MAEAVYYIWFRLAIEQPDERDYLEGWELWSVEETYSAALRETKQLREGKSEPHILNTPVSDIRIDQTIATLRIPHAQS